MNRNFMMLGIAALAVAGAVCAQDPPPAKAPAKKTGGNSAAAARGKDLFEKKCGICHYADSDAKKIGPGLKGISKRGTFTVNNNKVTNAEGVDRKRRHADAAVQGCAGTRANKRYHRLRENSVRAQKLKRARVAPTSK